MDFGLFSRFLFIDSGFIGQIPKIQVSGDRFRTIFFTKHLEESQIQTLKLLIQNAKRQTPNPKLQTPTLNIIHRFPLQSTWNCTDPTVKSINLPVAIWATTAANPMHNVNVAIAIKTFFCHRRYRFSKVSSLQPVCSVNMVVIRLLRKVWYISDF